MEDQKPRRNVILKEDRKNAERQFIREFVEVYRNLPALWDVSNKLYTNRLLKAEQYRKLVAKYQERYPDADKEEVTKKINSLRTNFRKELKRVREAIERDAQLDDVTPTLWYFEEMSFLANQDTSNSFKVDNSLDHEDMVVRREPKRTIDQETPTTSDANKTIKLEIKNLSLQEKRKRHSSYSTGSLTKMASRHQHPQHPDDTDKIVSVWAAELRKMDPQQQLFAKKAINDILFEGQMGTLHRNSVEINVANTGFNPSLHAVCISPPNSSQSFS